MSFLVVEIVFHLAIAAAVGVVLGYAIWGLRRPPPRQPPRGVETERLREELAALSAERMRLAVDLRETRDELSELRKQMERGGVAEVVPLRSGSAAGRGEGRKGSD